MALITAERGSYNVVGAQSIKHVTGIAGAASGVPVYQLFLSNGADNLLLADTANLLLNSGASYGVVVQVANLRLVYKISAANGTYAVEGNAETLTAVVVRALAASSGSYVLSGKAVTSAGARKIACSVGAYSHSGKAVTFGLLARRLSGGVGGYSVTGSTAALGGSVSISALGGQYLITGMPTSSSGTRTISANSGAYSYGGVSTAFKFTSPGAIGSYAITGYAAAIGRRVALVLASESYVTSGKAATLQAGARSLTAQSIVYTLSGPQVAYDIIKPLDIGAYSYSGSVLGALATRFFTLGSGTYSLTGASVALETNSSFVLAPALPGVVTLSGVAASFVATRRMSAAVGSYNVSGKVAAIGRNRFIAESVGSYSYSGKTVVLSYSQLPSAAYSITCSVGSYNQPGSVADLRGGNRLSAAAGSYSVTGNTQRISFSLRIFTVTTIPYAVSGKNTSLPYTGPRFATRPTLVRSSPRRRPTTMPRRDGDQNRFIRRTG